MNIQIFGKRKCFDTKKAERFFSERRIKVQSIDLLRFGISPRELESVLSGVKNVNALIDWDSTSPQIALMKYMDDSNAKMCKLLEDPSLLKTPIVRNGRQATVGYQPDIWKTWQ